MDEGGGTDAPRRRILRATLELVGREGLAALTNRRVATAAGVSLGSLTYHFESQQALLREALDLFLGDEVQRLADLTERLASASLTPEQAAAALELLLQAETERRAAKMELYLQASRDPQLTQAAVRCFAAYDRLAAAALEALDVPDADRIAPVVVAVIDGLQLRRLASGSRTLKLAAPLEALLGALREDR